jgi:hypothetical protein
MAVEIRLSDVEELVFTIINTERLKLFIEKTMLNLEVELETVFQVVSTS